jgi:hypothetical protein
VANYDDRLGDYVDVPTRIAEFRSKYPDGSLQPADLSEPYRIQTIGERTYIVVVAAAYRTPDDQRPGVGMAYEQWPGATPYTKNSELQNAETSAWGRAIVAVLAADTKRGIASAEEVRNRQAEREPRQWDPIEQETLMNSWLEELRQANTAEEINSIGRRAKRSGELSPASFDKLTVAAGARKGELNGAER